MRVLLVASLVFRAPSGPAVGPGCLMCPWAAARPLAVRAASFARRVGSKPGQASPRPRAPQPGPPDPPVPSTPVGRGVLCVVARRLEARPGLAPSTGTAAWPWVVVCGSAVAINHQFRMQFPSSLFKY